MKNLFKIFIMINIFSFSAIAAVQSATFAAKVVSLDQKTVTVDANGNKIAVPRAAIQEKNPRPGDAIMVTLSGKELAKYLRTFAAKK